MKKTFDCVQMKYAGAEKVLQQTSTLTRTQEVRFWQEKSHQLRQRQESLRVHIGRITCDPNIWHGKPIIRSVHYPVEHILELFSSGMSIDDILAKYKDLEREDLLAVLEYVAMPTMHDNTPMT